MADLCTACMCTGRNLYYIGDTGFYHLYSQILNEISVYDSSPLFIRVCWECLAHLRKWLRFKEQAKRCYTQLQFVHQNIPQQPEPHLTVSELYNFSYPDTLIKTELHSPPSPELSVKVEEHCEETFVHDLNVEPKRRRRDSKKVDKVEKPIKVKSKKKIKPLTEKIPIKKKLKIKKNRSPSPASLPEQLDEPDLLEDDLDVKENILEVAQKKEECVKEVGVVKESPVVSCATRARSELPERPHCVECGKNFSSNKTYRYHLNVLHKGQNRYPCPRCGKVYQWKSNLGRHLRSHKARDSGELYCETCDKRFASVATYRQHLRVSRRHVPESDFSFMCNECGKKFVNKTRLRDHIDWDHLKKIKFRCQLCNKPFKCHTSLYVHLQNVHRNKEKKDNLCHVCGKSYQNAAKLKYHIIAMHTSETPYQCQQCTAAFGWYSSLYRHVREVHYKMKLQPKKSKKSKKSDILPPLLPTQVVLPPMHQPGP